ncbi:hypothetical protein [Streptomyces sp. H39-C1]|uniref:hypothetical protein n=1 Tax=Streptomyces sp. H39-C1 TaxID=3004355 RepID=UPI0022AEDC47|nr:hypothetical protein [Streptomyces sp. H39-C1]MCZ4098041.1 hypothetical protein [Streptomyces sp. H39-C1]
MGLFDEETATDTEAGPQGTGFMGGGLPAIAQQATVVFKAPAGTTLDSVPPPHPPVGAGELSPEEAQEFEACKAGMDNLHRAFWIAGKSLETMKTANLHRNEGIPNFADYVYNTWEVSESQAQRLMSEWRLGETLAQLGWRPRESQVRELTEVVKQAGHDAGVAVYDALARSGEKVTATAVRAVVQQLPPLAPDTPPAEVSRLTRDLLHAQRAARAAAAGGATSADETSAVTLPAQATGDSPIGESNGEGGGEAAAPAESSDIERLRRALAALNDAAKAVNQAAVRRARAADPALAELLVKDIDEALDRLRRTVDARRKS